MDIHEVARRAGVSIATVSRTINRVPSVSPALAQKVWQAIEELGYYPNTQARALVSGKSRIFGLVVSDITNPFFPGIVHAFEGLAVEHGYELLLTSTVHDPRRMQIAVRRMIERCVEGVAVMTFGMEEALLEDLRLRQVPLVFVDVASPSQRVTNIEIDYHSGMREAFAHLTALGHRDIGFIAGPADLKSAQKRVRVFKQTIAAAGLRLRPKWLLPGDHTLEGGMRALTQWAEMRQRPSALLCSNDMSAIGVLREAFERRIAVPGDLSLVGLDDIRLAQFTAPPLTTIQMSQSELAELAFRALLDQVRKTPGGERAPGTGRYRLSTRLVVRASTARLITTRSASRGSQKV